MPEHLFPCPSTPSTHTNPGWTLPGWRAWVTALLFALAAAGWFSRRATFPYFYHMDEPTKVEQVLTGKLNFHHPLLLLKSTTAILHLGNLPWTAQTVVETGRHVSVTSAAVAVAALVLLAWQLGGALGGVLAGVALLANPLLFELAHYMKEDCVLLAGIAVCFATLGWYSHTPFLKAAAVAGLAAGLAASGKYVGFSMVPIGLAAILCTRAFRIAWKPALLFVLIALTVFGGINFESFATPHNAASGLGSEFNSLQVAAQDQTSVFHWNYFLGFTKHLPFPLFLGSLFWAFRRWRQRRLEPVFTWLLIGFPYLLILAMSFSPKVKNRYMLPGVLILSVLGAAGIVELAKTRSFRHARLAAILLAAASIAWPLPTLWQRYTQFGVDDRQEMIAWMRDNLPADAKMVVDPRTCLLYAKKSGNPLYQFPQEIDGSTQYVANLGTLDQLRARGIHYAVVADQNFRFYVGKQKPSSSSKKNAHTAFYNELFAKGELLWKRPRNLLVYIHPGLRVYRF